MHKAIYTSIIGKGYKLREPDKVCPGWDYYCFTDQDIKSNVYTIVYMKEFEHVPDKNNRRLSKFVKISNLFEGISIYIDAKFRPVDNLDKFVEINLGEYDIALLKHNKRDCVYAEAKFCANNKIEKWDNLALQIEKYLKQGLPKGYGLWAPGIMIRRYSNAINKFNTLWWNEYLFGNTDRDMFSLAYSIWSFPQLKIGLMPFRSTYNRWSK